MKPLKEHIEMLLKEGVIEGPLGTEEATEGWVHNVVITTKGWDSSKIRMNSKSAKPILYDKTNLIRANDCGLLRMYRMKLVPLYWIDMVNGIKGEVLHE